MHKNIYTKILTWLVAIMVMIFMVGGSGIFSQIDNNSGETKNTSQKSSEQKYQNKTMGIALTLPVGYKADESYVYKNLGPGKEIKGVKFAVPSSLSTSTNLGRGSYFSVESLPNSTSCSASSFVSPGLVAKGITDGNVVYSVASTTGAAAGNRYEESVYALSGTNPCIAVRYFIHYHVFENYPAGTIKRFDKQALINQFDKMRRSLVVSK